MLNVLTTVKNKTNNKKQTQRNRRKLGGDEYVIALIVVGFAGVYVGVN